MTEIAKVELKLKIQDLETFDRLVSALGAWADEAQDRGSLTAAEQELFDSAVELADAGGDRG